MDRSTETLSYAAWSADISISSTQYRTKMVLQNCSPETARDFLLDDNHRREWDDARVSSTTLEDWNESGCQVAQWVRKFPLFLRDREYVVARRIWSLQERTYHCISKLTTHPAAPRKPSPWRVEGFSSRWTIRACEGAGGGGAMTACEIVNFHQEESGLSRNIAKMAVSRGMWAYVQKVEVAIRQYGAAGRNIRHALPVFIIQADAKVEQTEAATAMAVIESEGEAATKAEEGVTAGDVMAATVAAEEGDGAAEKGEEGTNEEEEEEEIFESAETEIMEDAE
eukprot:TRINITY_DN21445_c0_g1_i1.p1 TRINITY_DN21445_c0_g1~~TRINITY_DN21445_c0_g1_i1.p1  ORF type:complete len:318 (+),score=66.77 TRINITY_DN21445_c0_g1_i1:110-955(+)